ncbi:MAG TPA: ABC transporter permease [Thermoanaerobaculia bacterium]
MRLDKVRVLTKREYLSRIKTKGFWISTVAVPLLFAALGVLPAVVMSKTTTEHALVVVDETGRLGEGLARRLVREAAREAVEEEAEGAPAEVAEETLGEGPVRFDVTVTAPAPAGEARGRQRAELERRVLEEEIDAWVWISEEGLARDRVEYHAESVSNFVTQEVLEGAISEEVRRLRFADAGIDAELVEELGRGVDLETVRVTEEGSRAEAGFAGVVLAYVLFFLLYMVIVLYGQQVMNSVIEEKSSRAVEVVISTVKPFELMMGKLFGVGLVGLTQLAIWLGSMAALTAPAVLSALAFVPEDAGIPSLDPSLAFHFVICFILGYFLYASFYAAIGSAFNNVQEAQQLASVAVIFLIAPLVLFVPVINDPGATWAAVASMVPLFTPLLMMLRIAVKEPPLWQIAVGYGGTALFVLFMIWLTARIYRVGILMYGKKPTVKEIWRWVRYA